MEKAWWAVPTLQKLAVACSSVLLAAVCALQSSADEELERHLQELHSQLEDPKVDIARREVLLLEMAGTLDRNGQASGSIEARRSRWSQAVELLDRFETKNPGHPRAHEVQFQAAVYLWARAQSWQQQAELDPTDTTARQEAVKGLDAAIGRLRALQETLPPGDPGVLGQNVRFRLAQALADRAELDPERSPDRRRREDEALKALTAPTGEPGLRAYAHLLRAELLGRVGRFEAADEALEAAAREKPPLPVSELLRTRIAILSGSRRFEEAIRAIDEAKIDAAARNALAVRVLLDQRSGTASATERGAAESAVFERIKALRAAGGPELHVALLELARRMIEPDRKQEPEAWEAVAEGTVALGDLNRACQLEIRAAERAEALGRPEDAARLRLRAGAYLYQAERFAEADTVLTQVVENSRAGAARAGAGMLRALARGRALAVGRAGATRKAYIEALEAQIRDFPTDPSTDEARWLLGRLRLATGEKEAARAHWASITPGNAHWADARLGLARMAQSELDTLRITGDRRPLDSRYNAARTFLNQCLAESRSPADTATLELALARLELTPIVGDPDSARLRCEELIKSASRDDQRDEARRLHLVAVAELNRFGEAEQVALDESRRSRPVDLIETARLLDHLASESESDLKMRRFGLILRTLLSTAFDHPEELSEEQLTELRLRLCRSLLFRGDDVGARRALSSSSGKLPENNLDFLKDLADTYFRLEAYSMAIDVERLRIKRLESGSPQWFDSRYRLALAEYRSRRTKEALHLIDATAILHPDLGGGELREKFLRLRQRIGPEP